MKLHFEAIDRIYIMEDSSSHSKIFSMNNWRSGTVLFFTFFHNEMLLGLLVEHVQRGDSGFFRLLDLRFGQLDSTHGDHSTDCKMGRNAASAKPERPVQAVLQHNQHKEMFTIVGHPLRQTVVPHGCQETQQGQGTEKSLKARRRRVSERGGRV